MMGVLQRLLNGACACSCGEEASTRLLIEFILWMYPCWALREFNNAYTSSHHASSSYL